MYEAIIPAIGIMLIPLITVKGLSFSTYDKIGKTENFDQKMFSNLKFTNDNAIKTT